MRDNLSRLLVIVFGAVLLMGCFIISQAQSGQVVLPIPLAPSTRIVMNGKKIFPIGLYHVSWAGTPQQMSDALEKIGAAGFNLMHPALKASDLAFVRRAAVLGVNLVIESNDPNGTRDIVDAFKGEPNILGWLVSDDFNSETRVQSQAHIQEQVDLIKRTAPNQYSYMSGGTRNLESFIGLTNMIGVQTYSIPAEELNVTDHLLSSAFALTSPKNVSLIANLQAWSPQDQRIPTPEEVRNITYQSLLNGVDGILYYTYFDETWDLDDHPLLWEELTRIAAEVHTLTPMLLDGTLSAIDSGVADVRIGQWSYEEKRTLVIINMAPERVPNFTLDVGQVKNIAPLFIDRPSPLTLTDGLISGTLEPTSVYVYVIE